MNGDDDTDIVELLIGANASLDNGGGTAILCAIDYRNTKV